MYNDHTHVTIHSRTHPDCNVNTVDRWAYMEDPVNTDTIGHGYGHADG